MPKEKIRVRVIARGPSPAVGSQTTVSRQCKIPVTNQNSSACRGRGEGNEDITQGSGINVEEVASIRH
eukprot:5792385-Pyramimonas_sp.AAC.1